MLLEISNIQGKHIDIFVFSLFSKWQDLFLTPCKIFSSIICSLNLLSKTSKRNQNHMASSQTMPVHFDVWSGTRYTLASKLAVCREADGKRNPLTSGSNQNSKPQCSGRLYFGALPNPVRMNAINP